MKLTFYFLTLVTLMGVVHVAAAQSSLPESDDELRRLIIHHDSLFWLAYNNCDTAAMRSHLADDLEFYHDKGGLTEGGDELIKGTKQGICRTPDFYLRREAVPGTVHVDPVPGHGAIIYGEHLFYINEKGKEEYLDGQANFVHVWTLTDGGWKMTRVLSFSHRPPERGIVKKQVAVADGLLTQYAGTYISPAFGEVVVTKHKQGLTLKAGDFEATLYPESDNTFFVKERDLQFRFMSADSGKVEKIEVIESGKLVDQAKRKD